MTSNYIQKEGYDPNAENPNDFFPTPPDLCRAALALMPEPFQDTDNVLDVGCGTGNWGKALRSYNNNLTLDGIDIAKYEINPNPYNNLFLFDYRDWTSEKKYDKIIGNTPYTRSGGVRDMRLAEKFVFKSLDLLREGGFLMFLLRTEFLHGERRAKTLYSKYKPIKVFVSNSRVSWFPEKGSGNTLGYSIFLWQKGSFTNPTTVHYFGWKGGVAKLF